MDFNALPDAALKACLKDANMASHHPEITKILAVRTAKPKVTVPEDQKISVNHGGFSAVVYLNKRYLSPVSFKGKRLFQDSKFGGYPVLREDELRVYGEFLGEVSKVFEANKA
jgi:hypothetical protein